MSEMNQESPYILDILSRVARFIPFQDLPAVSDWPYPAEETVQPETRRRIWAKLKPYIPKPARPYFFSNLATSGGALVGDFALHILLSIVEFSKTYKDAGDPEIALRSGHEDPIISFFEDVGYTCEQVPVPEGLQEAVERVQYLTKDVDGEFFRIRVYISKTTAIAVVLASPYTAYWNAITQTEIVVFCPRTTFANKSLVCEGFFHDPSSSTVPFDVLQDNSTWTSSCGKECPMMRRKTFGDQGAGIFRWWPDGESEEGKLWLSPWEVNGWVWMSEEEREQHTRRSQFCMSEAIEWRVGSQCHNSRCQNGLLAAARRRVIPTL